MDYSDIIELSAIYAGYVAGVFATAYGAIALWGFFKSLANPDIRND